MLSGIFGGKPWYRSLTGIGVAGFAVVQALESVGAIAPGTGAQAAETAQTASALLIALGLRKAANGGVAQKS